ncbi:hypothetical protein AVEN_44990-1 [Araneus ventricosus]|uniref:Uncharacterized protein n=1 Tax=Araneus ventricosus TaxID=182803 RepID=A0A4Y2S7Z4_ARAVE|nr:hypothetical protein AVEN_44990-1 [Araneus ventricosus]
MLQKNVAISQIRRFPPARATFFPNLLLLPTQCTCRSLWNQESVSERGVQIRAESPKPNPNGESGSVRGVRVPIRTESPDPYGESESLTRNGFVPFGRTRQGSYASLQVLKSPYFYI